MKAKKVKVRTPFTKNQKGGPILSKKDKERKRDRRKTKVTLKQTCWSNDGG